MSEEILKFMIFIVHLIQQRILHHDDLKKLKQTDDTNFITAFQNFATEFVTFLTVKEQEIQNLIHAINFNSNDLIIENDDAKMCYEAKKNEKKLQHDEYEIISIKKKKNNKSEKKIIKLFN